MSYNSMIMNKTNFDTYEEWRIEQFKDPEFVKAYHELDEEFALIELMIQARQEARLTQAQLAEKTGMKQAAIARLESGKSNPSLSTLNRIAAAFDKKVAFVPR